MDQEAPAKAIRFWEEEMLAEYVAARYPQERVLTRVRLGPIKPDWQDPTLDAEELRLLGNSWRRWADAVVITAQELLVVESKLVPDHGDISQLEVYLLLARVTPELAPWRALPIRGLLVWGVDDPFAHQLAVGRGLSVEIYRPSHWGEWIRAKRARENRKTRPKVTRLGIEALR